MKGRVDKAIFVTPLDNPQGVRVLRYLGLARSTVVDVIPPHLEFLTLFSSAKRERSPISRFISSIIGEAIQDLQSKARRLGGNAILGLRIETSYMGWGRVVVHAYGTVAEVKV